MKGEIITKLKTKDFWIRNFLAIASIFILAFNYNLFLLHNNLVTGGTSGISIILNQYIGLSPAFFILVFNIILIILSFIMLGKEKTGMTIAGSILYPLFVSLTTDVSAFLADKIILDEFLLVILISGIIYGTANGIIYRTGYSTGGMDTVIAILSKYLNVPVGTASFLANFLIIVAGGMVFGLSKAIYAIIIIVINSYFVDKIMLGISDSKMFYINTKETAKIKKLIKDIHSGYTIMKTEGGYTSEESNIIMCVVPTNQYFYFKNTVEKIDPSAFIIISDCYEVYGGHRKERFPFI